MSEALWLDVLVSGRDWDRLWERLFELPLVEAVGAVQRIDPQWRPDRGPDRLLYQRLVSADPGRLAAAAWLIGARPLTLTFGRKVHGLALSPDGTRLSVRLTGRQVPLDVALATGTVVESPDEERPALHPTAGDRLAGSDVGVPGPRATDRRDRVEADERVKRMDSIPGVEVWWSDGDLRDRPCLPNVRSRNPNTGVVAATPDRIVVLSKGWRQNPGREWPDYDGWQPYHKLTGWRIDTAGSSAQPYAGTHLNHVWHIAGAGAMTPIEHHGLVAVRYIPPQLPDEAAPDEHIAIYDLSTLERVDTAFGVTWLTPRQLSTSGGGRYVAFTTLPPSGVTVHGPVPSPAARIAAAPLYAATPADLATLAGALTTDYAADLRVRELLQQLHAVLEHRVGAEEADAP